jgi:hypothetical protein
MRLEDKVKTARSNVELIAASGIWLPLELDTSANPLIDRL